MKLSDIRVDVQVSEQGDWVDDIPGMDGLRLKVRGVGNADYRRLESKLLRNVAAKRLGTAKQEEAAEAVSVEVLGKTVLLDWDGLFEDDGTTAIKYSPELAARMLADPELRAFRNAVIYAGNEIASRRKQGAEIEKN